MKVHVGVEASSGLAHTVIGTAGNVADVVRAHTLPHSDEFATFGDAGCHGVERRPENIVKSVTWHAAHETLQTLGAAKKQTGAYRKLAHLKASVMVKIKQPFHVVENLFRHRKTRHRGLTKNTAQKSIVQCLPRYASLFLSEILPQSLMRTISKLTSTASPNHANSLSSFQAVPLSLAYSSVQPHH